MTVEERTPTLKTPTLYIVGAGPGDPKLLTLKARSLLQRADLVAYDDLLHPQILAHTRPGSRLLPVGYRGKIHHQGQNSGEGTEEASPRQLPLSYGHLPQRHPLVHDNVVKAVLQGQLVVRLKCGDPMIFGRSGEEEEELNRLGIVCRYVPGITAALGAASHLGVPLTDRRHSSEVIFRTATSQDPSKKTLVLYMPRKNLSSICKQLLNEGWAAETPVVFVAGATTAAEKVAYGRLSDLSPLDACLASHLPGLVIIGETAGFSKIGTEPQLAAKRSLDRSETRENSDCLSGMRVLLLQSQLQAKVQKRVEAESQKTVSEKALGKLLTRSGADLVTYPLLSPVPLNKDKLQSRAILETCEGVFLRSRRDMKFFLQSLSECEFDIRTLGPNKPFVCANHATIQALGKRGILGIHVDSWGRSRDRLLVPCDLEEIIRSETRSKTISPNTAETSWTWWPCYRTLARSFRVRSPLPDAVVALQEEALHLFWAENEEDPGFFWQDTPWYVLDPMLSQKLQRRGVKRVITVDSPQELLRALLKGKPQEKKVEGGSAEVLTAKSHPPAETERRGLLGAEAVSRAESSLSEKPPGQLIVYTGHGKGKTTAALGLMLRSVGQGLKVQVIQFIKGKWMTGERLAAAARFQDVSFQVMGKGFTWESDDLGDDRRLARKAWEYASQVISSGQTDVVILDELTYIIHYGFVGLEEILHCLKTKPSHITCVLTGRNASKELIELADLVTEMQEVKHPFKIGKKATRGIDY